MGELTINLSGIAGSKILCAVSGGADSVSLLRLLAAARDKGEIGLVAAHFEHGIRGEESLDDMRFVEKLCARLNVELCTGRGNVPSEAAKSGEGTEACARRLRHEFLRRTMAERGCGYIALAHHRKDRAETVLMHLLRGGGLTGASSMGERDGIIIRPLIDRSPEELRAYLKSIGQDWREDSTNAVPDNPRNALRLNVFPLLEEIYPGFEKALTRFAEISDREDEFMSLFTDEFIKTSVKSYAGIRILPLGGPMALLRRAARRFLPRDCGYDDTERVFTAKGWADIGAGTRVYGDENRVFIVPPLSVPEPAGVDLNAETRLEGICKLRCLGSESAPIKNNGPTQVLRRSALEGCELRLRRPGDRIAPLGMKGRTRLLSDVLTDRKIPVPVRDRLPVLAKGDEIIWARGVCVSESARVIFGTKAVKLTIDMEDTLYDA